jgi:hypothetical protein
MPPIAWGLHAAPHFFYNIAKGTILSPLDLRPIRFDWPPERTETDLARGLVGKLTDEAKPDCSRHQSACVILNFSLPPHARPFA